MERDRFRLCRSFHREPRWSHPWWGRHSCLPSNHLHIAPCTSLWNWGIIVPPVVLPGIFSKPHFSRTIEHVCVFPVHPGLTPPDASPGFVLPTLPHSPPG